MTLHPTSRRTVAGRFALLIAAPLCLLAALTSSPALAQQHGAGGARPMPSGNPGGMRMERSPAPNALRTNPLRANPLRPERGPNLTPTGRGNLGRFNRPGDVNRPAADYRNDSRLQPRMGLQLGLGGRWWDNHGTARKLSLNNDQQRRMDTIFEANKPTLVNLYTNLQHEEQNLAGLSHADLQDESKVFAAIDRVAQARSELEKENAHCLLQIRQQLDPQQVEALDHQISSSH